MKEEEGATLCWCVWVVAIGFLIVYYVSFFFFICSRGCFHGKGKGRVGALPCDSKSHLQDIQPLEARDITIEAQTSFATLFHTCVFSHVRRDGNRVAHLLALKDFIVGLLFLVGGWTS